MNWDRVRSVTAFLPVLIVLVAGGITVAVTVTILRPLWRDGPPPAAPEPTTAPLPTASSAPQLNRPPGYTALGTVGDGSFWQANAYTFQPDAYRVCYALVKGNGLAIWCGPWPTGP